MIFKVMGKVYNKNNTVQSVCYGEFQEYEDAYDYKEYLENSNDWIETKPYMIYIEEVAGYENNGY